MDRNPDEYSRTGYRAHPYYPPPQRWTEPVLGSFPPPNYIPPHHKGCCCPSVDSRLYVIERKITSIQSTVEALASRIGPAEEQPQQQHSNTESTMSNSGSVIMEQDTRPIVIPGTSKERKELIKRMEQELDERREENRHHEERISDLKRELEQLRARNSK